MDKISFAAKSTDDVTEFTRGLKVLLLDHDTDSLQFTLSVLAFYSYDVVAVQKASVALSLINEQSLYYKLVIANVDMSDSHSVCFLHALLQKDVAVVLMFIDMNDDLMKKARDKGEKFMLQKSVTIEDIKNVWQEVYLQNTDSCLQKWGDCINSLDFNDFDINEVSKVSAHPFGGTKTPEDDEACRSVTGNSSKGDSGFRNYLKEFDSRGTNEYIPAKSNEKTTSRKKNSVDHKVKHAKMKRVKSTRQERNIKKNNTVKIKNERMTWTDELIFQFSAAVSALGDAKARPKAIVEMMGEDKVTLRQVASFLQKYKIIVAKIQQQNSTDTEKTMPSNSSSSNQQTSSFGEKGGEAKPTGSATPSSSISSLFPAASSNNYDTIMQQHPNSSLGGILGYGNRGTNLPNNSSTNAGMFQQMNRLKERSHLAYRNQLNSYPKIRDPQASEVSRFKASNDLPSMRYLNSKADYPNMSSSTFQLPNQPPVVHQQQFYSSAMTKPFGYRSNEYNSTGVLNQQKMNLPSMNYSSPYANAPYAPASLPSMDYMRPYTTPVNQEAIYSQVNFYSCETNSTNNSSLTEAERTNEQDFLLNLTTKQYTITDVEASIQRSANAAHLPQEPLAADQDQFWTPELCADFDALFGNMSSEGATGLAFPEGGTPSFAANNVSNPPAVNFNSAAAGEVPIIVPSTEQQPLSQYAQEPVEYNSFGNASNEGYPDDDLKWIDDIFTDGTEEQ